jgi:hypothetical protein
MINDNVKPTGELEIILRDANGNIKLQKTVRNLVVTVGKNVIASRLAGTTTGVMTHMAVGTSPTTPVAANTTLGSEIVSGRVALPVPGGTPVANVVTYVATFGPGVGTGAIVEAGIFNASSVGSMLCRTTFSVVNKDAGDSLTINWALTIA